MSASESHKQKMQGDDNDAYSETLEDIFGHALVETNISAVE